MTRLICCNELIFEGIPLVETYFTFLNYPNRHLELKLKNTDFDKYLKKK